MTAYGCPKHCLHCELVTARAVVEMHKTDKERIRKERDYLREISEGMRAEITALKAKVAEVEAIAEEYIDRTDPVVEAVAAERDALKARNALLEAVVTVRNEALTRTEDERDAAIAALEQISKTWPVGYEPPSVCIAREALARLKGGAK